MPPRFERLRKAARMSESRVSRLKGEPFVRVPQPPEWVQPQEREFWDATVRDYVIEGPALAMLEVACSAMQRLREARDVLDREGLVVEGRYAGMTRQHPLVTVERDARVQLLRALRELDLDGEPLPTPKGRR
jgi:phage terminase small subunit